MRRADEEMGFLLRYENVAWYEDGVVTDLGVFSPYCLDTYIQAAKGR